MGKQAALKFEEEAPRPPDDMEVHLVPIDLIRPAPWNPPARMDPKTVEELADSIATAGQQIPVLLRPVDDPNFFDAEPPTVRFEVVFGHRRLAAFHILAGRTFTYAADHRDPDGKICIKSFIRSMSEQEAMILSGIENLQRQGFSDIEEAEFFRAAGQRYGESAVKILAEKLSVSDRYIRKRVAILDLPEPALEMWKSNKWHVGHMEQLLRLGGDDEVVKFLDTIKKRYEYRSGGVENLPVYEVRECINNLAIPLSHGRFDKSDCKVCRKNTDCQLRLFGGEKDKVQCLDQKCFRERQQAWFDVNWATCKANKVGTQAAIIGDYDTKSTGTFGGYGDPEPSEKCATCGFYTSILNLKGEAQYSSNSRVCMGEKDCFADIKAAQKKAGADSKAEPSDPDAPRVEWHGEFYRQEFYKEEVTRRYSEMPNPEVHARPLTHRGPNKLRLVLAVMVSQDKKLQEWLLESLGKEWPNRGVHSSWMRLDLAELIDVLKGVESDQFILDLLCRAAIHDPIQIRTRYTDRDRQAIAEYFDADWSRFAVTEDYLSKKTRPELIRFIVLDSDLVLDGNFTVALAARSKGKDISARLEKLKKPELIDLILTCGVDLHDRLPREIADRPKLGGKASTAENAESAETDNEGGNL